MIRGAVSDADGSTIALHTGQSGGPSSNGVHHGIRVFMLSTPTVLLFIYFIVLPVILNTCCNFCR